MLEEVRHNDGCIYLGAVVGKDVFSGRVNQSFRIGLVWKSGGEVVVSFCMPAQTKGAVYSINGGGRVGSEKLSWCKL